MNNSIKTYMCDLVPLVGVALPFKQPKMTKNTVRIYNSKLLEEGKDALALPIPIHTPYVDADTLTNHDTPYSVQICGSDAVLLDMLTGNSIVFPRQGLIELDQIVELLSNSLVIVKDNRDGPYLADPALGSERAHLGVVTLNGLYIAEHVWGQLHQCTTNRYSGRGYRDMDRRRDGWGGARGRGGWDSRTTQHEPSYPEDSSQGFEKGGWGNRESRTTQLDNPEVTQHSKVTTLPLEGAATSASASIATLASIDAVLGKEGNKRFPPKAKATLPITHPQYGQAVLKCTALLQEELKTVVPLSMETPAEIMVIAGIVLATSENPSPELGSLYVDTGRALGLECIAPYVLCGDRSTKVLTEYLHESYGTLSPHNGGAHILNNYIASLHTVRGKELMDAALAVYARGGNEDDLAGLGLFVDWKKYVVDTTSTDPTPVVEKPKRRGRPKVTADKVAE